MNLFGVLNRIFGNMPATRNSAPSISIIMDDLTEQETDGIVNAADWTLLGGTGVDGAIHEKAGLELRKYIHDRKARLAVGGVFVSPGFKLKAKWIFHVCAPLPHEMPDAAEVLEFCFSEAVRVADKKGLKSLALPLLGGGAFGWDIEDVAEACHRGLNKSASLCSHLERIDIIVIEERPFQILERKFGMKGTRRKEPGELSYHAGVNAAFLSDS